MYCRKILHKIRSLATLSLALLALNVTYGQDRAGMSSSYMTRAMESLQNNDAETCLKYLKSEIANNSTNGYAYAWLAYVYKYYEEAGKSINAAELALKYLPKKDKEYLGWIHGVRGEVYMTNLEDYDNALKDFNQQISNLPKGEDGYGNRAQLYYTMEKYDLSDKDYRKYIDLAPGKPLGYMGIGRNAKMQGRYKDAITQFDKVVHMFGDDYSSGFSFRGEVYQLMGEYEKAADDYVKALAIDGDSKALYQLCTLADSSLMSAITRLKIQRNSNPNEQTWPFYMGRVYNYVKKYKKAIECYEAANAIEPHATIYQDIADCQSDLGEYTKALSNIEKSINMDSTKANSYLIKANCYYYLGNDDEAINTINRYIQEAPNFYYGYYRRGFFHYNMKKYEEAIEDYTASIALRDDYAYSYFGRGDAYKALGERALARRDYQKVISLDTTPKLGSCAHFAYLELGHDKNAIAFINRIIEKNPDYKGIYYDAACLYARMGECDKAMDYFKTAVKKGYREITHAIRDDDLNCLHDRQEFKNIVSQYSDKQGLGNTTTDEEILGELKTTEIPFERRNGVTEVKCTINGLPLYFIFDTGAGDVTISMVEANFMFKNGYLSNKDIIGKQSYMVATGEVAEGTVINLSNVEFGGMKLSNVRASVVKSQTAPLLLGQSVLSRLGKIEIDNQKRVLKVSYRE